MLLINCSNTENNCYGYLKSIKREEDTLISLSHKKMDFCLGCQSCQKKLENYCVLNDYITSDVYKEIINNDKIVFASPMYMSNVNGILKNLLDRFNPFYNHQLLRDKKIYLLMSGFASKEENESEIKGIIEYFEGIKEYLYFDFEFLDYFVDSDSEDIKEENKKKLDNIKERMGL